MRKNKEDSSIQAYEIQVCVKKVTIIPAAICSIWVSVIVVIFLALDVNASRWMTRSVNDLRTPPFREPPPIDFHPGFGPDYGQSYHHQQSFTNMNMIPTQPPPFFEFFDPVTGTHHKIVNEFSKFLSIPAPQPQEYSRSYKLQDASPFPSTYDKKRRPTFNAPHENSYANDHQFYTDFASKRIESIMNSPQFSGPFGSHGNGVNDNLVYYLLSDWRDYRI